MGEILKNLGLCLIVVEPHPSAAKDIWYRVWPQIRKIPGRDSYLSCCVVWVEFVVKNFGVSNTVVISRKMQVLKSLFSSEDNGFVFVFYSRKSSILSSKI
jgi:hypothetical protein